VALDQTYAHRVNLATNLLIRNLRTSPTGTLVLMLGVRAADPFAVGPAASVAEAQYQVGACAWLARSAAHLSFTPQPVKCCLGTPERKSLEAQWSQPNQRRTLPPRLKSG
jgi:hypothetical protein